MPSPGPGHDWEHAQARRRNRTPRFDGLGQRLDADLAVMRERTVARWEAAYPTFAMDDMPELTFREFEAALLSATNLMEAGEDERARRLLRDCRSYPETAGRRDESYMLDPWIHSLLGRKQEALDAPRYAIEEQNARDQGLLFEPWHFDFVGEEPEFQRLVDIVRTDLARRLERVRDMERNGEPPPAPGVEWK